MSFAGFDKDKKIVKECGVAELAKVLEGLETAHVVVFDGVVTQRLVDVTAKKKTSLLIGAAVADIEHKPPFMKIFTFDDVSRK